MRIDTQTQGAYVIAPTPFTETGEVDMTSIDRLVDGYLEAGAAGITILGIMGEATKLMPDESLAITERFLKRVDGRVPVVVGVSAPGILPMVKTAHRAMALGAGGVMLAPAQGLKTDAAVEAYMVEAAQALGPDVPICFQDYPLTTGVNFTVDTYQRILERCPSVIMFKHEDWPGLAKLAEIRKREREGKLRRVSILTANGGLFLASELHLGADGCMTGYAFAEALVGICRYFAEGQAEQGEDLFDAHLPLIRLEAQPGVGLAIRKEIYRRRGLIASAAIRRPGPRLAASDVAELDRQLARLARRLSELGEPLPSGLAA
ncbi:MAG: dihydrodipicolinate synthase family protein [Geminicoccaceae bacterium]|nr:MAG: dihydrodipicolinate synthase family protein [Geminicoccaceae bacterium]